MIELLTKSSSQVSRLARLARAISRLLGMVKQSALLVIMMMLLGMRIEGAQKKAFYVFEVE